MSVTELRPVKNLTDEDKKDLLEFLDTCRYKIENDEVDDVILIARETTGLRDWVCLHRSKAPMGDIIGGLEMLKMQTILRSLGVIV